MRASASPGVTRRRSGPAVTFGRNRCAGISAGAPGASRGCSPLSPPEPMNCRGRSPARSYAPDRLVKRATAIGVRACRHGMQLSSNKPFNQLLSIRIRILTAQCGITGSMETNPWLPSRRGARNRGDGGLYDGASRSAITAGFDACFAPLSHRMMMACTDTGTAVTAILLPRA